MLNLNKKQKNEIFGIIEEKGLSPNRFSWTTRPQQLSGLEIISRRHIHRVMTLIIQHEGKEFRFTFEDYERGYRSSIVPQIVPGEDFVFAESWVGFLQKFENWLEIVKYELEEPDLWKNLPRGQALMAIPSNYSYAEKFSVEECRLIAERLSKIEKFILESNQSSGASAIKIQQTFIYLQQRTETASKLDWKNIFAGAIVGLILEKTVDNAPEVMKLCNELLSPFFQKLFQLTHAS